MSKPKNPSSPDPTQPQEPAKEPKRYPSRENLRYIAIPKELHAALEQYAKDESDEDTTKSVSWAARVAIRRFLKEVGYLPPKDG